MRFRSTPSVFFVRVLSQLYSNHHVDPLDRLRWAFAGATLVQAVAHGWMATCAGLLGRALVRTQLGSHGGFVDAGTLAFSPLHLCFLGLLGAVAKTGAGAVSDYGRKRAAFSVGNALRQEVTDAILQAGPSAPSPAHTHAAISVSLREVERGVDEGVLSAVRSVLQLVPLGIALIALSSRLALAALSMLAPFGLVLAVVRKRLRASHAQASRLAEQLHTDIDELVRNLDLWRTYGASGRIRQAIGTAGIRAAMASARSDAARATISGANEVLAATALLAAVALVEHGGLAPGDGSLVAFSAIFFLMYRPLRDLGDARVAIERGAHALDELDGVCATLDTSAGATTVHSAMRTPRTEPDPCSSWGAEGLDVRALSVLRDGHATPATTFQARPGEIVALVGPTGSGKTSLLRALLGLERRLEGGIGFGGRDLLGAGVGPTERPFAWVPQEAAIVAGTLADNILLGAPEAATSDAFAIAALRMIGAGSLLAREERVLTAGGLGLSGGERQWVAIARALASGLPVLLLDEPTAGLDPLSQERVLAALKAIRGKRTVILVTHRPEPLTIADRVVTLGNAAFGKTPSLDTRFPDQ